jgi:hypothetical protein
MRSFIILVACCGLVVAGPAQAAKPDGTAVPAQVQQLLECRAVLAPEERLNCFDRQTAAMGQALASNNLVVVDRDQARAARRSVFGFSVPNFGGLFGGGDSEISEIESTIRSTARNAERGWVITLADGSVWSQTDDWPGLDPRPGRKVVVKRAALGSYRLMIPGQNGIKVRRVG